MFANVRGNCACSGPLEGRKWYFWPGPWVAAPLPLDSLGDLFLSEMSGCGWVVAGVWSALLQGKFLLEFVLSRLLVANSLADSPPADSAGSPADSPRDSCPWSDSWVVWDARLTCGSGESLHQHRDWLSAPAPLKTRNPSLRQTGLPTPSSLLPRPLHFTWPARENWDLNLNYLFSFSKVMYNFGIHPGRCWEHAWCRSNCLETRTTEPNMSVICARFSLCSPFLISSCCHRFCPCVCVCVCVCLSVFRSFPSRLLALNSFIKKSECRGIGHVLFSTCSQHF